MFSGFASFISKPVELQTEDTRRLQYPLTLMSVGLPKVLDGWLILILPSFINFLESNDINHDDRKLFLNFLLYDLVIIFIYKCGDLLIWTFEIFCYYINFLNLFCILLIAFRIDLIHFLIFFFIHHFLITPVELFGSWGSLDDFIRLCNWTILLCYICVRWCFWRHLTILNLLLMRKRRLLHSLHLLLFFRLTLVNLRRWWCLFFLFLFMLCLLPLCEQLLKSQPLWNSRKEAVIEFTDVSLVSDLKWPSETICQRPQYGGWVSILFITHG